MSKLLLVLFFLGVAQRSYSMSIEDPSQDVDDYDFDEEEEADRSWWSSILSTFKKSIKLEALTCNGPSCSSCLSANVPKLHDKKGCFTLTYNQGSVTLNLNLAGNTVWRTNFNSKNPVPSCTNIKAPNKQVCIQDFSVNLPNGHGDVCFTLAFKSYGFGVRYCMTVNGRHFMPGHHPSLVKL